MAFALGGCAALRDAGPTPPPEPSAPTPVEADAQAQAARAEADERRGILETVESAVSSVLGRDEAANYEFVVEAPGTLVDAIRERTFVGRWQRRKDFEPIQFQGLVARLKDEVQQIARASGYFNARVDVDSAPGKVTVKVDAGARTTVNKADIEIVGPARDDPRLLAELSDVWTLPEGAFFDSQRWQSSKRELIEVLNRSGYLRARVTDSQARIDRALTAASLSVTVDSGERLKFGELRIEGLQRYDERVVRDLRPFSVGSPYSSAVLLEFQTRLRTAGYFEDVSALPDLTALERDPTLDQVPIQVNVNELKTKRVVLGVGFSTDEGPRGQIGLEHRDLFSRNWRLTSALVVSARNQRAFGHVRTPFDSDNYFWGFGGRLAREDIENQVTTSSNTYIGRGRRQGDIEGFLSVQYQLETERVRAGGGMPASESSQRAFVVGYAWNLRRVDSTIDPSDGYSLTAQLSGATEGLFGTDRTFVRTYLRGTRFQPLADAGMFKNSLLLLSGEFGLVAAGDREGIPTENLFRTGGAQTIRGYDYRSLGVREAGAIVGGRYLLLGSVEYQHRMSDLYSLAAFVDLGNATDSRKDYSPVFGYGVGARFRTPIGPINFDVAYGEAENQFRVHFSVGYVF